MSENRECPSFKASKGEAVPPGAGPQSLGNPPSPVFETGYGGTGAEDGVLSVFPKDRNRGSRRVNKMGFKIDFYILPIQELKNCIGVVNINC
jgi:hypothetical protein